MLYIGPTPSERQTLHEKLVETLNPDIRNKIADYPNLVFDIQRMSRSDTCFRAISGSLRLAF